MTKCNQTKKQTMIGGNNTNLPTRTPLKTEEGCISVLRKGKI